MSDVMVCIYFIVTICLVVAIMFHSALRHRRIVLCLTWLAIIGVFVSTIGGVILFGIFTPSVADYSKTSGEMYNAFTYGRMAPPRYDQMLKDINTVGAAINAMGMGVLVMAVLSGFFPRYFFTSARK
ncbi:MAG: hypothetical protein ACYC21_07180 [Eubacteriales bacterium]